MKIFKVNWLIVFIFLFTGILGVAEETEKEKNKGKDEVKKEKIEGKDKGEDEVKDEVKKEEPKEDAKETNRVWAETYQEIKNRLESVKMNFEFKDKTIFEAVEYFQDSLLIRFRLTSKVYSDYKTKIVSVSLKNLQAKMALRLAISMYDLKCLYDDGGLVIMAPDETVAGEYVTVIYRIDDLLAPPPEDFEGPDVDSNLQGAGGAAFPIPPAMPPKEQKNVTKEEIEEAIKSQTGAKLWEDNKKVSLTMTSQFLVVTHTKSVHKKVIEVLNTLRAVKR
ncbi:MAG: hypothetical protein HY811_02340 [Planctomycetes bacterium]|nr:hypothetical protein [Planctomycetota bacterium]